MRMTISDRIYHKSNTPENPKGHKNLLDTGTAKINLLEARTARQHLLDFGPATKSLPETGTAGKISTETNYLLNEPIRNSIGCKEIILDTRTAITCFVDAEFLES